MSRKKTNNSVTIAGKLTLLTSINFSVSFVISVPMYGTIVSCRVENDRMIAGKMISLNLENYIYHMSYKGFF